jgi:hypothetical protein
MENYFYCMNILTPGSFTEIACSYYLWLSGLTLIIPDGVAVSADLPAFI